MKYAVPLLVLLMGADLVTTFIGLRAGAIESNPLWPVEAMVPAKLFAIIAVVALFYVAYPWRPAHYFARGFTGLMGLVVVNNLIVLALQVQGGMNT